MVKTTINLRLIKFLKFLGHFLRLNISEQLRKKGYIKLKMKRKTIQIKNLYLPMTEWKKKRKI